MEDFLSTSSEEFPDDLSVIDYLNIYLGLLQTDKITKPSANERIGGMAFLQKMFDINFPAFRQHGTPEELMKQVNIIRGAPATERLVAVPMIHMKVSNVYISDTGKKYIHRADLLRYFRHQIITFHPPTENKIFLEILGNLVTVCMARCFLQYPDKSELICCEHADIAIIACDIKTHIKRILEFWNSPSQSEQIREIVAKRLPQNLSFLAEELKLNIANAKRMNPHLALEEIERIQYEQAYFANLVLTLFQQTIEQRPALFAPNFSKPIGEPVILKIFEDGNHEFTTNFDLIDSLNLQLPENNEYGINTFDLAYISLELANKIVFDTQKNTNIVIEMVRIPIIRNKYTTLPTLCARRMQFILSVDNQMNYITGMILRKKLFQRFENAADWNEVDEEFHYMTAFLATTWLDNIAEQITGAHVDMLLPEFQDRQVKEIRLVGTTGFTQEYLKEEIEYLNLTVAFPDIIQYVAPVYAHIVQNKKKEVLRDCDMFDAIYHCQLIALVAKFPALANAFHNHKACHRVLIINCPCRDENEVLQAVEEGLGNLLVEPQVYQREKSKKKTNKKKNRGQNNTVTLEKPQERHPKTGIELKTENPARQLESANCAKCFRTSEMHEQTKKALTKSETSLRSVDSQLRKNNKVLAEFEEIKREEMEVLKYRLTQKDKKIEALSALNAELVANHSDEKTALSAELEKMKAENQKLQETLKKRDQSDGKLEGIITGLHSMLAGVMEGTIAPARNKNEGLSRNMERLFQLHQTKNNECISENAIETAEAKKALLDNAHQSGEANNWINDEYNFFVKKQKTYESIISNNLRMMESNYILRPQDLVTLPEKPCLSYKFQRAFVRAEVNAEVEIQCDLCIEKKTPEELIKCNICPFKRCKNDCFGPREMPEICPGCRQ